MNRRSFLATAGVLPVAASLSSCSTLGASASTSPTEGYEPWLEIQLEHFSFNVKQVAKLAGGRPIMAVIKGDAYGHGLVGTATHLEKLPEVWGFAVVKVKEAMDLRESGIRKPILLLGPTTDTQLAQVTRLGIMPVVYTDRGKVLAQLAAKYHEPIKVHFYLDTGMGRVGVPYYMAMPVIEALAGHEGVVFDGILTELSEEDEFDREQVRRLEQIHAAAGSKGINLGQRHAASSGGIFHVPQAHLDMVRPGISLFGCYPDGRSERSRTTVLKPVMSLKARVMYAKRLRVGDSLQYHRSYVAKKPVWVATIPVGHTDGLPRQTANSSEVLIEGRRYPVIASVTANHCLIEVGDEETVKAGDEVVLLGTSQGEVIGPHDIAKNTKISVYSLVMHMNPLLPKRYL